MRGILKCPYKLHTYRFKAFGSFGPSELQMYFIFLCSLSSLKKIFLKRAVKQNNNFYSKNNNLTEMSMLRLADNHLWYVMVKTVSLII